MDLGGVHCERDARHKGPLSVLRLLLQNQRTVTTPGRPSHSGSFLCGQESYCLDRGIRTPPGQLRGIWILSRKVVLWIHQNPPVELDTTGQARLVEHLPNVKRPWVSFLGQKDGIQACRPSMREAGAGQSEGEGHPPLHREFEASTSYMRHYFGKQEQKEIHKVHRTWCI